MELRQLRYFAEIARCGSFTKAADILAVAQPALTAQMHKLEAEFGAKLFNRSTRGITLTPVGEMVLEQAQRSIDAADAAKRAARFVSDAPDANLIVAFTRLCPFPPISRLVRRLRRTRPNATITLREMWSTDQFDALESGTIDVGFVHYTNARKNADLHFVPAASEVIVVALPPGHGAASRRQMRLADLAGEGWIVPAYLGESVRDVMLAACLREGFAPRIVQECSDARILIGLVAAGLGIGMLTSSMKDNTVRGVHFATIVPRIELPFVVAYRRDAAGKFIKGLIESGRD